MSPIYLSGGKIIVDGNKLGCCCNDCTCSCGSTLNIVGGELITLTITQKLGVGPPLVRNFCINNLSDGNFDPGPPAPIEEAECVNDRYRIRWFDGTYYHYIYFGAVDLGGCNCESGVDCSYSICGWDEIGPPDGINIGDNYSIINITTSTGCE